MDSSGLRERTTLDRKMGGLDGEQYVLSAAHPGNVPLGDTLGFLRTTTLHERSIPEVLVFAFDFIL